MHSDQRSPAAPARDHDTGVIPVAPGTSLDAWLSRSWEGGLQIDELDDLTAVRVETRNSTYHLAIVSGARGKVLVRGGRYFPDWTPAQLLGCSFGGGLLKRHGVHLGMHMELCCGGRVVITSAVSAVQSLVPNRGS